MAKKTQNNVPKKHWPGCSVELRSIETLLPYARNSRTHSDSQVAQIAASIKEFGFTNPVLAAEDGTIIAGHGRILAARKMGLEQVPVMVATGWTPAQIKAYVIADNKLAENAGWDNELLAIEIEDLRADGFDLDLLGFSDKEMDKLFGTQQDEAGDAESDNPPAVWGIVINVDSEEEQVALLERLSGEGLRVRAIL
ncbi:hypothetical protein GCM10007036_14170 [Alsobacter metallidurans]|uniref:ParB-like N-terminal domain-containing protein n=1 Tax=Alsobacter metallidurans TaxID=340221 RepID=A0A917MJ17_9HYPH|nr:ParB N-terminal domain-containing protein [Alsobacter metallidurans]GGH14671.1 hypothetical protein GCM10007036_14170 [Alsobacter metallidurans]